MKSFVVSYLLITGIGTLIVGTFPWIIALGYLLLIIPGLILSLLPTAFLYGVAFSIVWWPLRSLVGDWPAAALAVVGAAGILWAIPTGVNMIIDARIAADRSGDKEVASPIAIKGIVRVERTNWNYESYESRAGKAWITRAQQNNLAGRGETDWTTRPLACDAVCAAVLFTPGVEAVIVAPISQDAKLADHEPPARPAQFRIVRSPGCVSDVEIGAPQNSGLGSWNGGDALLAEWQASGACITREAPGQPDFTIRATEHFHSSKNGSDWTLLDHYRRVTRVAISDRSGVVMQRTMVETVRLDVPLSVGGTGGIDNFRLHWSRQTLADGRQSGFFKPFEWLEKFTNLRLKGDPAVAASAARRQLSVVLADPTRPASDPAFSLPGAVFADIAKNGMQAGDQQLVARIAADWRTRELLGLAGLIQSLGADAIWLRRPIVERLLHGATSKNEGGRNAGSALFSMPPHTFADVTDDELTLLKDSDRRNDATGLIKRQADRGAKAVPLLLAMLEDIIVRRAEAGKRSGPQRDDDAYEAIQYTLAVVGPDAAFGRLRLEALLNSQLGLKERTKTARWEVALVRMGREPESFTKPDGIGGSEQHYHRSLRADVDRFERDLERGR